MILINFGGIRPHRKFSASGNYYFQNLKTIHFYFYLRIHYIAMFYMFMNISRLYVYRHGTRYYLISFSLLFAVPKCYHRHLDQLWRNKYATYLHIKERCTQNYNEYLFLLCSCFFIISANIRIVHNIMYILQNEFHNIPSHQPLFSNIY